jgi:ribonuclease P protein component
MLPRQHRLTRPDDFRRTIRSGSKVVTPTVIVYGLMSGDQPPRIGVTVNKAVGGSVARHRVARQIRHTMAALVTGQPQGSAWVIRALPAAAGSTTVAEDVQQGVGTIIRRWEAQRP